MLVRLVWDQYVYRILPYPVNAKQEALTFSGTWENKFPIAPTPYNRPRLSFFVLSRTPHARVRLSSLTYEDFISDVHVFVSVP